MTADRYRVRSLNDPEAVDVTTSGAKAAGLARARACGFPVLDGFVLPPACSEEALGRALAVLESRGTGGARMSIIRHPLPESLNKQIESHAAALQPPFIVRSSSVLEGSGEWSGAFTSVPEVQVGEIGRAAKSVWATCFSMEVLERFEAAELAPGSAPMGVLVQPEIQPEFGGAALVDADGGVTVDAVKGSPRDLMAGWVPGVRATYEQGALLGDECVALMGDDHTRAIAKMALQVEEVLNCNLIEWAIVQGIPLLLQVQRSADQKTEEPMVVPAALAHPFALEFVRLAHRFPGEMGDELVLGWISAAPRDLAASAYTPSGDRDSVLRRARQIAAKLTAQAWGQPEDQALKQAEFVLRRMRSDRPNESIDALRELKPVDPVLGGRLLGMVEFLMATDAAPPRRGMGRWEPVLAGVLALQGDAYEGEPGVGGVGSGRMVWIDSSKQTGHVRPRDIIVTQYPLQNFSPLLWDAAGIVTVGGASTAHLLEVARSLTVPAVINCPIAEAVKSGPHLGMLDGGAGRVAVVKG
ncbi:PEP-utilizing enzyme [Candidatus Poriferisocius sp.]|uniref:PEP-utilizing enzyme n=1 Tax=Candidatus Poriferisocius sp. TaxID=3101276 RepID=UPI003B5C5FF0